MLQKSPTIRAPVMITAPIKDRIIMNFFDVCFFCGGCVVVVCGFVVCVVVVVCGVFSIVVC